jgi:hypothetical protein
MIDIHFTLTEKEYLEAQALFLRESDRKARRWRWPLTAFLFVCLAVFWSLPKPIDWSDITTWVFVVLVCLAFLPRKLLRRHLFRKRFQKEGALFVDVHTVLDDASYRNEIPGIGHSVTEWKAMTDWAEGDSVFIVKQTLLIRIIPTHVLSEPQREELRALFTRQIGPEGVSR